MTKTTYLNLAQTELVVIYYQQSSKQLNNTQLFQHDKGDNTKQATVIDEILTRQRQSP